MLQIQPVVASNTVAPAVPFRLCLDCGEPIQPKRLAAKPHARRCVSCQAKYDVVLTERPTNLARLGFVAPARSDDDSPLSGFHIGAVPLSELMGEPESTPGQATNTKHRVISPHGRQKMSEMAHARRNEEVYKQVVYGTT